jgi:hypothetical protein
MISFFLSFFLSFADVHRCLSQALFLFESTPASFYTPEASHITFALKEVTTCLAERAGTASPEDSIASIAFSHRRQSLDASSMRASHARPLLDLVTAPVIGLADLILHQVTLPNQLAAPPTDAPPAAAAPASSPSTTPAATPRSRSADSSTNGPAVVVWDVRTDDE